MESKTMPTGTAAICRADQVVWLDKLAATSLPVTNAGTHDQPTLEAQLQSARCPECGAPLQHSWDERCPYCGAAVQAPTKVVVLTTDANDERGTGGGERKGLFGEVMNVLTRPVD
jgi:rubrerythrin